MTKIFDISPKIRPYVQDFELNFVLRMFAMMVQFLDISTKICDQNFDQDFGDLDHHFRYFTKMFKILTQNYVIFLQNVDQNLASLVQNQYKSLKDLQSNEDF